jgi:hypothetical protein
MARRPRLPVPLAGVGMAALAGMLAGCGDEGDYSNLPRPPSPIVVTASIGKGSVAVSPRRFGAGPVRLVVTNQTDSAQQIIFESAGSGGGFTQRSGPINPRGTAELKAEVPQGRAVVRVSGKGIDASRVTVGPQRRSGQDELLQP